LAKQCGNSDEDIETAYKALRQHSGLWEEIRQKLFIYPNSYGLQMTKELPSLYMIIKLTKPDLVLETGVASGASSTYILRALHDNKKGELYSIDLPPDNLPEGQKVGFVVPESLRSRWSLHIGDSKELLQPLLDEIGKIDSFIHDSLHTYEHMMWEFRTTWKYLCQRGFLLSHDVGSNDAFFDFMKEKGIPWSSYRVFHVLGAFQKP
jgi:cephalosporin hydroxylase